MGGSSEGRALEQTATWAVAIVCFVLIAIFIVIDHIILKIEQWFKKKQQKGLHESLEKIKAELMLMGFISLLLSVGTTPITNICISKTAASTWHPCSSSNQNTPINYEETSAAAGINIEELEIRRRRRLLDWYDSGRGRVLVGSSADNKCAEKGKVSFMSYDGVHQLHVFIFVLALSHVFYSLLTMALGRLKMRSWKHWERETKTQEYQFSHDSKRFRFARETSFGRRHISFWSKFPISLWIACFFRQIIGSVTKVDYLTLRHGFIMAHLAPHNHSRFDFSKYINRSLEEDFKVVVGISPPIWLFAVVFMLFNTHGWYSYLWLPFVPLIIVLLVGTKLLVIISKMGLKIQEKGVVVKGVPVVQPSDDLFWFNRPRLLLYLLNFVLFQNAFQLAFFSLTAYQFGLKSCFHEHAEDLIIKITMGILIQILCSYVILPLYALVTQMGSTMRPTIFNDRVATALRKWHHTARRKIKENKKWGQMTSPVSSRPETPSNWHRLSPVHLLAHYQNNIHHFQDSLTRLNLNNENWDVVSPSPTNPMSRDSTCQHEIELGYMNQGIDQVHDIGSSQVALCSNVAIENEHEMVIEVLKDFSFDKRSNI